MLEISKVYKNSIAFELGLKKGDKITEFNGFKAEDVLDYLYYDSLSFFTVTADCDGEEIEFEIEKDEDESLGVEFLSDNLEIKKCRNKCVFCFVDQMPKGLRESLYIKDDDYRQSFLRGNFVTLTNVSDSDIDRIIRLNLSPLYVSVQATDKEIREKLLGNRFAGDILDKLKKLTENGIKIHTQVVLVPSLNDGAVLENTCHDLVCLGSNILSIAVVPCGITKFREGLFKIEDIDKDYATSVINQLRYLNNLLKTDIISGADEFYFRAGIPVESEDFYRDFPQIENGVGVTAKFLSEIKESVKNKKHDKKYLVIVGTSASEFIKGQVEYISTFVKGLKAGVLTVENEFFGNTVNCTGLLVGKDILNALKSTRNFDYDGVILPDVCLKREETVFLDGVTLEDVKKEINCKIIITDGSGQSFFDSLSGGKRVRII
ncbi:MAG: DUF512 domain-containing protein [Clostridiales bacterium]|nr:DUF512 domain-containing protein [Clostridiales bacterium]